MDTKLHPAVTVSNIKNLIPITLDNETGQYVSWSTLFKIHCRAYLVEDHLKPRTTPTSTTTDAGKSAADTTKQTDDLWNRLDAIVLQWIYDTISVDLLNTILKPTTTAYEAWTTLETLFQDNKSSRYIYLTQKLQNTHLDNFDNMNAYCQEVKVLADQLANVDASLSDEKMVQQLVADLNEQYEGIAMLISNLTPLPTFHEARSKLMREFDRKASIALHASQNTATALNANTSKPENNPNRNEHRSTEPYTDRGRGRSRSRGRGRGRSNGRSNSNYRGQQQYGGQNPVSSQWVFQPTWGQQPQTAQWPNTPPCPYPTTPRHTNNSQAPGILGPRPQTAYSAGYAPTDID